MPFDEKRTGPAARALMVNDPGIGYEKDVPVFPPKAHAPVQILAVEEITFVPGTDILHGLAFDQHAGAGDGFDSGWFSRQRFFVKKKI
jgi:hypothetical protein